MYRRGRYSQITRVLRVLDRLRGYRNGVLLEDLAKDVGVSVRQIRRDIHALEDAGHQIDYPLRDGRAAAKLVQKSYSDVSLTKRERYTLLAVRRVFDALKSTPFFEDIENVCEKLQESLPSALKQEAAVFDRRFLYVPEGGVKEYAGKEEVLDALQTGVLSRRVVRYTYRQARGQEQHGLIAPYAMALYKLGLYVVARRLSKPEDGMTSPAPGAVPAVFAAERFTEAEFLPRTSFVVPEDLDLESLFQGAFGLHLGGSATVRTERVVVEFAKSKRALVLGRKWHPTQKIEALPDGRVRLEFECRDLSPVVSWVLSWGPHARVVEPASLVERVAAELDEAASGYRPTSRAL